MVWSAVAFAAENVMSQVTVIEPMDIPPARHGVANLGRLPPRTSPLNPNSTLTLNP